MICYDHAPESDQKVISANKYGIYKYIGNDKDDADDVDGTKYFALDRGLCNVENAYQHTQKLKHHRERSISCRSNLQRT